MYIEMAIHTHQKPQRGERYISTQKVLFLNSRSAAYKRLFATDATVLNSLTILSSQLLY